MRTTNEGAGACRSHLALILATLSLALASSVAAQPAPAPAPPAQTPPAFPPRAPDPPVPPQGLAPYFTRATAAPKAPDADGFLQRWLLLEPIEKPNRTNTGFTGTYVREAFATRYFPGQFTVVPRDGQVAKAAKPLRWHALDSSLWDVKLFYFSQGLGLPRYGVIFWAVTIVDSPREMRNVRLAVGSNSASMWWVNGKEAASLFDDRRMVMDDVVSPPLTLKKGRNIIRGAVINGPGLSDFCVRFLDAEGLPVRDIALLAR